MWKWIFLFYYYYYYVEFGLWFKEFLLFNLFRNCSHFYTVYTIFRGPRLIGRLTDGQFYSQVMPVPLLFCDRWSRYNIRSDWSVELVLFVMLCANCKFEVQRYVSASERGHHQAKKQTNKQINLTLSETKTVWCIVRKKIIHSARPTWLKDDRRQLKCMMRELFLRKNNFTTSKQVMNILIEVAVSLWSSTM